MGGLKMNKQILIAVGLSSLIAFGVSDAYAQGLTDDQLDELKQTMAQWDDYVSDSYPKWVLKEMWKVQLDEYYIEHFPDTAEETSEILKPSRDAPPPPPPCFMYACIDGKIPRAFGDPFVVEDPRFVNEDIENLWPDQYYHWNTEYSPNRDRLFLLDRDCDGILDPADRALWGRGVVFIDFNENGKVDCATELLMDSDIKPSTILKIFTPDGSGIIDPNHPLYHKMKVTNFYDVWTFEELGYHTFHTNGFIDIPDDCFGPGRYLNGLHGYVIDDALVDCIESGGLDDLEIYTDYRIRGQGYNPYGILTTEGQYYPVIEAVVNFWNADVIYE